MFSDPPECRRRRPNPSRRWSRAIGTPITCPASPASRRRCRARLRAAAAGSGASDNAEMTATPSAPAPITSAALLASMPAMPHTGNSRRAAVQHADDTRQPGGTDRRVLLLLRQRDIDAAAADIVDQLDRRGLGLGHALDRQADHRARPEQAARILDRHVVRPEMHAVGAGGERHIDAIVDDQRHAERRQRLFDRPRRRRPWRRFRCACRAIE